MNARAFKMPHRGILWIYFICHTLLIRSNIIELHFESSSYKIVSWDLANVTSRFHAKLAGWNKSLHRMSAAYDILYKGTIHWQTLVTLFFLSSVINHHILCRLTKTEWIHAVKIHVHKSACIHYLCTKLFCFRPCLSVFYHILSLQ